MAIGHTLLGWKKSDFTIYEEVFHKYGGSVNAHPDVVRFFLKNKTLTFRFWHCVRHGEVIAAYFDTNGKHVGLNVWRDYPISYDEIVLPVASEEKIFLPHKSNRISSHQRGNIKNSFFLFRTKRQVCLAKQSHSVKTTKKRNSEMRRFLSSGGESVKLAEMTACEIAKLYVYLFKLRFGDRVKCYSANNIEELLSEIPHMVFGNALFYKGSPCAMDLVLFGGNDKFLYFDVPNGGLDPAIEEFSPGSLLMWQNISDARAICEAGNQKMLFSIGLYKSDWNYKLLWADALPTGKSLAF
ncbi:GNAT family N-acetyltransferase [Enterobacter sp.]|uniref:GNAT family N-acetyltransferase n=1 Tax=Enterobacter sp. TaxID=42895 RepID=UPI00296E2BED|nr:GNAT family N-acetyltransferase [Enterobacter sp.]